MNTMQLLCDGQALDLYENVAVQFTQDNPLFAFDNIKCERSTQLKIPATPTNDVVLSLARVPATSGEGMRRRFNAVMRFGIVEKSGYLYVSQFSGSDYSVVFVCGEFVGLQKIKDLGKIPDIVTLDANVVTGGTITLPQNADNMLFGNVQYLYKAPIGDEEGQHPNYLKPSISIRLLLQAICTQNGLRMPSIPASVQNARLICAHAYLPRRTARLRCVMTTPAPEPVDNPTQWLNSLVYETDIFGYQETQYAVYYNVTGIYTDKFYKVRQFKCLIDMKVTMPDDMPDTMYIYDLSHTRSHTTTDNYGDFYGEYMFYKPVNGSVTRTGEPLKGRVVEFHAGDCFSFVDERDFVNTDVSGVTNYGFLFHLHNYFDTSVAVKCTPSNTEDAESGQTVYIQDNLPTCTVIDLLKAIAYISGTVLNYTNEQGVTFETLETMGGVIDIERPQKTSEIKRTFAKYGQHNYISFESSDWVKEPLQADYPIDNVNLSEENKIADVKFNEGSDAGFMITVEWLTTKQSAAGVLYLAGGGDEYTLANTGDAYFPEIGYDPSYYLMRVQLPLNNRIKNLCAASTQIQVQARMSIIEYNAINPKTVIYLNGNRYVWTSSQWQNDVAKLTLAKII